MRTRRAATALVALICLAAASASSRAAPPTCHPGPPVRAVAGALGFHVFADCIDERGEWLGLAAALTAVPPPTRAAMDRLLRGLYAQVRRTMGHSFPRRVELCVYPAGTDAWSTQFLGCIKRGFENEETEGGPPDQDDDDAPQIENYAPFTPAEEVRRIDGFFGGEHGRKPTVTADEARHTMKIVYPLVERGTNRWALRPTFVDVALAFFSVATRVYPAPTTLTALDFVGVWRDTTVLRVHVADEHAFLSMGPWPMRERLSAAGVALDPKRPRTLAQTQLLERELRAALAKLPPGDVAVTLPVATP